MIDNNDSLEDVVIELHSLARIIESKIGNGALSASVRASADTLSDLIKVSYKAEA